MLPKLIFFPIFVIINPFGNDENDLHISSRDFFLPPKLLHRNLSHKIIISQSSNPIENLKPLTYLSINASLKFN